MRLIDADALKSHVGSFTGMFTDELGFVVSLNAVLLACDCAPTIDAEPVVRCKDCKYFMFGDYCMHDGAMEHSHARENDFCSYGERGAAEVDDDENV